MNRLLVFLILVVGLCNRPIKAQTSSATDTIVSEVDSYEHRILKELETIRGLQEETRNQRQKAVKERQRNDSIKNITSETDVTTDYGVMSKIEGNTRQNPIADGWNFYGFVAFFIAVISAGISWYTFKAQEKTVGNTKKLSQDAQRKLLNELLRHLYRNYVITYAMRSKMKDIEYKGYPSEEHFEKLKIPMENIHLEVFYDEEDKFGLMHVLYLNLRNYNDEIDVALKHMTNPNLSQTTKDEDFDILEFKVSYLTGRIVDTIYEMFGENEENKEDMRKALGLSLMGKTNATENIDVPNSANFDRLTLDSLKGTAYSKLFAGDELEKVCKIFNNDVAEERKKNYRGAWKVRMIKF